MKSILVNVRLVVPRSENQRYEEGYEVNERYNNYE